MIRTRDRIDDLLRCRYRSVRLWCMDRGWRRQVFVLGNQKSGTTAIAALIAALAQVDAQLDMPQLWYERFQELHDGRASLKAVGRAVPGFSRRIVKEPNLTFLKPQINEAFPHARIGLVVRDPRTNIRSILDRHGLAGNMPDLDDASRASLPDSWRAIFDPATLGGPAGTYVEVLAHRWNVACDVWLQRADDDVILLRYEDFLADKVAFIRDAAWQLGLPAKADISTRVDEQFQPAGDRIPLAVFFGEENLRRIAAVCGDRMRLLGYAPS